MNRKEVGKVVFPLELIVSDVKLESKGVIIWARGNRVSAVMKLGQCAASPRTFLLHHLLQ